MLDRGMGMGWGRDEGRRCGAWSGFNCADGLWSRCAGSFPDGYLAEAYTGAAAFQFGLRAADRPVEVIAAIIDAERPRPTHSTRLAMHSAAPISYTPKKDGDACGYYTPESRLYDQCKGGKWSDGVTRCALPKCAYNREGQGCVFIPDGAPGTIVDGGCTKLGIHEAMLGADLHELDAGGMLTGGRCAFVIGDLAAPSLVCDGGNKLTSGGAYGAGGCVATLSSCISGQDGKPCANYEGRDGKMVGGTCMWYPTGAPPA